MSVRGQATVELALGTLVFVTVLLFGIHFAEYAMVNLRVQQAASSALWDTTALPAHDLYNGGDRQRPRFFRPDRLRDEQGRTPADRAQDLYRDFDALADDGSNLTLSLTSARSLSVSCAPSVLSTLPTRGRAFEVLRLGYGYPLYGNREVDGMECGARAVVRPSGIPTSFFEGSSGFFNVPQVTRLAIPACAFGRPRNGRCEGAVPIAIDDWGLAGEHAPGNPWATCDERCLWDRRGGNQAYRTTVQRLFNRYSSARRTRNGFYIKVWLDQLFSRSPDYPALRTLPTDERQLRFNFIGEDGTGPRDPADDGRFGYQPYRPFHFHTREATTTDGYNFSWASTPFSPRYEDAYRNHRGACFLGSKCAQPIFDKRW